MAAILGLDRALVAQACDEAADVGPVQVANLNGPGQTVIAGATARGEEGDGPGQGERGPARGAPAGERTVPFRPAQTGGDATGGRCSGTSGSEI